jgi:hypothetical protein
MGMRKYSRSAHPEAWEELKKFRRLRRLTGQALRAKERGDVATMARMESLLRRLVPQGLFDDPIFQNEEPTLDPEVIQKPVPEGDAEIPLDNPDPEA